MVKPGHELVRAAGCVGTGLAAGRELGQRQPGDRDVIGGGVRPGISRPQDDGQRLPCAVRAMVGERAERVGPNIFFQVGAAFSSECAITTVASRPTVTSPPSAPGAAGPTICLRGARSAPSL